MNSEDICKRIKIDNISRNTLSYNTLSYNTLRQEIGILDKNMDFFQLTSWLSQLKKLSEECKKYKNNPSKDFANNRKNDYLYEDIKILESDIKDRVIYLATHFKWKIVNN